MKIQLTRNIALIILWLVIGEGLQGQGFVNLNFESAKISGYSPGASIPATNALPGWAVNLPTVYDGLSIGGAFISINDTNTGSGFVPIEGKFSAYLFSQGLNSPFAANISQVGLVPIGTMSLQAKMSWFGAAPVVTLGGQVINMVPLQTFSTYTLYAGDIISFAGQIAQLSFTEPPPAHGSPGSLLIDNIIFSPQAIPEPNAFTLFIVSNLLASVFRRRKIRNKS